MGKYVKWSFTKLVDMIIKILDNKFDCFIVLEGNRGLGKTQTKNSKVLMSDGTWKNVEDIKKGDEVLSPHQDGSFTFEKVIETHSRLEKDIFEVREQTRKQRLLYTCAGNHEIPILRISHPRARDKNGIFTGKRLSKQVLDLRDAETISKMYTKGSHICSFTTTAIDYKNKKDSSIDAYSLGAWLGDGSFTNSLMLHFGEKKKEIIEYISKIYPIMSSYKKKENKRNKDYRFSIKSKFAEELIRLGLKGKKSGTKFIPKECLLSSINYRLNLLAGLIDTDGYVMKKKDNHISITTKSKQLAEDIKYLVFSLGGYSNLKKIKKKCQNNFEGEYFEISICFKDPNIIPLKTIKENRIGNNMLHNPTHIAIQCIKKNKGERVYGFSITGKSKWYITDNWMVTHNSTFAYELARAISNRKKKEKIKEYRFHPRRNLLYTRKEVIKFFHRRKDTGIADEMINVTFNRDFYNEDQKDLIKMINMNRDHCNLFLACVPQFVNLDNQVKQLCKIRITIVRRGLAIIQTPNRSIYSKDRWDTAINEKKERKWLEKGVANPRYANLTTFRGYIKFPPLKEKQELIYQKVKDDKRNVVAREQMGIKDEEEKLTDPHEIAIKLLEEGKIRNSVQLEGIGLGAGIDGNNFRSTIRRRLKKEGKPDQLAEYYWDKKNQLKVVDEASMTW